jgi:hypothetical protein
MGTDEAHSIQQTADGGYVVAGFTNSNDNDVSDNHGGFDCWVVKLNESGDMTWQKCLGGRFHEKAYGVQQTADGWYIVAGYTISDDGDVSGKHGPSDFWVVRLDVFGTLIWQKCLGGTDHEEAYSVQAADRDYIVAGWTLSNDGDVSDNHGGRDLWIVKLGEIDCTITAPEMVCPGSAGNVASTARSGATYAWSITNGMITSPSDRQSITFTAGTSGTTRLAVNVTKGGYWNECHKDIAIGLLDCRWTSNAPVCNGMPVQFDGPSGMEAYQWDFGDGSSSQAEDPSHLYFAPGTYAVKLIMAKCGSLKSCPGTVVVKPMPNCRWTSSSPVCDGTPVQFTGPAGEDSYRWDFGDGQTSSA